VREEGGGQKAEGTGRRAQGGACIRQDIKD